MTAPSPTGSTVSTTRRVFDLLVIVVIACGLLGLAWRVAREGGRTDEEPKGSLSATDPPMPESPELQLLLPLEKFGMVLTRQHVDGHSEQALAVLDQRCQEVLAAADDWVLSLAVSPEEQQLLDSLVGTEPLPGSSNQSPPLAQLYPLTQPTGRAGIRDGSGAAAGRRLICWGFIVSDGADGYSVWFAQPREKLPRSVSREGHAP